MLTSEKMKKQEEAQKMLAGEQRLQEETILRVNEKKQKEFEETRNWLASFSVTVEASDLELPWIDKLLDEEFYEVTVDTDVWTEKRVQNESGADTLTMFQEHQKQIELARIIVPQYFQTAATEKELNEYIRQNKRAMRSDVEAYEEQQKEIAELRQQLELFEGLKEKEAELLLVQTVKEIKYVVPEGAKNNRKVFYIKDANDTVEQLTNDWTLLNFSPEVIKAVMKEGMIRQFVPLDLDVKVYHDKQQIQRLRWNAMCRHPNFEGMLADGSIEGLDLPYVKKTFPDEFIKLTVE